VKKLGLNSPDEVCTPLDSITDNKDNSVMEAFKFEHDGRTFSCTIEGPGANRTERWWWFGVSTDDRHRYAPFQVDSADTQQSVRSRIVTYYDDLMVRRAMPATSYWRRGAPAKPATAAPTTPPAAAPAAGPAAAPATTAR
jgi:hypothetical protein